MGQNRTWLLRHRRQQPECKYARYQCQAHKVLCLPDVRSACRYRRLCLLPSCRLRFTLPCKRSRNECDRFIHHRRHDAFRRFGNIIGTLFGVISLSTIKNIVSSLGLDDAWWTNITVAAMICLFLVIQSVVLSRKNKKRHKHKPH